MTAPIDKKTRDEIRNAATSGELFAYFGYGSLVNRATHRTNTYGAMRATVRGWRRHWQGRPHGEEGPISLLSIKSEQDERHDLPGLLVFDHQENLPALDLRESGYVRRSIDPSRIETEMDFNFEGSVFIYEARPPAAVGERHAILQSYLDAVLQGYLKEYGPNHVERFLADTHAFDTPIIRDRDTPRYPRNVKLRDDERKLFDEVLRDHGAVLEDDR